MMSPFDRREIRDLVKHIARGIAVGKVEELIELGVQSEVTDSEASDVVSQYGRTLMGLPDHVFDESFVVDVSGSEPGWSVDVPLFTAEEGISDLTMRLFIPRGTGSVVLEDVLVP